MAAVEAMFGHVNLTGRDWRRLAAFYSDVFGCRPVPPERDIRGAMLDAATGLTDAHLTGVHLRLPGGGEAGPTLEIFAYDDLEDPVPTRVDRSGWGHLAFAVPDVAVALDAVLAAGGGRVGETVTTTTADGRRVTWCYVTDPEGNIVELQTWSSATRQQARIPTDLTRVAEARSVIRAVAESFDAPTACADDLVQAVDEAITNAIVHGYQGAPGWIEVMAERVGDQIVVTLQDTAPTFDPTAVPEPDLTVPPERRRPGGMGVHLMRLATDSITHAPRPGGGNILTMTRRLDKSA